MNISDKKILISIPCRDTVSVGFVEGLMQLIKPCVCCYRFGVGGLVFDARDEAAQIAVNMGYDYILYIDSDMLFEPSALLKALAHDDDIVTGLYFKRKGNHEPVIYKTIDRRTDGEYGVLSHSVATVETDIDRPYFPVEGCGFGFVLIKTEVLTKMFSKHVSLFEPIPGMGEDLSFCQRIKEDFPEYKIMCDSEIWLGHMGEYVFERKDWTDERNIK